MIVNTMTDEELERELLPEFRHIYEVHGHETSKKWVKAISKRDVFPIILKKTYLTKKNNTIRYYGYFTDRKARKDGYLGILITTMRTNKGICTFLYSKQEEGDYIVMFAPHTVNRLVQRAGANITHEESTDEFVRRFASDSGCFGYEYYNGDVAFFFKDGALLGKYVTEHFKVARTFVSNDLFYKEQREDCEAAFKEHREMVEDYKSWHRKQFKSY